MTGKVWLVGAGPGDPGLFTLRGREVLAGADVVVCDALVGPGVLTMIPETARLIYAGKRAGNHALPQEEINRILLEEARQGRKVVRLKGGDPFLFGRGGEELELLAAHGIPFEVVPGVPSALAVPAFQGIPVTHRDFCSSVHIVTGHRRKGAEADVDYSALVRTGGTLVFLMGAAALPDICRGLLAAGMDETTPAAVLERGATARQRRIAGTLGTLEEICGKTEVRTPAVIVVGQVCALAEDFAWYDKRPLAGVRVLVTRPRERSAGLTDLLRQRGAEVWEAPAIRTAPIAVNKALTDSIHKLEEKGFDWLVFTSPSGVHIFFNALFEHSDVRALGGVKIAVIGQGSKDALEKYGVKADFIPSVYDGETLGRELADALSPGARVLIPRAAMGNRELVEELGKAEDAVIDDIAAYDTLPVSSSVLDEKSLLETGEVDFVTFTSASAVRGFAGGLETLDFSKVNAVCIGKQTRAAAEALGMRTWMARQATMEALADCVEQAAAEWKEEQP